ncbi:MAG TPA: hypothetical protein VKD66_17110 [Streptosporangiaceae bacterium]|nr:hypothetical protein [Streptosporangiaceae bacterium]
MALKPKYMVVLPGPFSLDIPYTDRQRVVIVADDQLDAERRWRAGRMLETSESQGEDALVPGHVVEGTVEQSSAATIGRHLHRGLESLQYVGAGMAQAVDDRAARWALRHKLGALMIGRTEAGVLRLDQGHPLTNVLYVGHPAKRELYYPAAEFHRRVFEHKFVEAVTLLTSLGASRIAVQQEEGETRDRERTSVAAGLGFTRTRQEQSRSGAEFEAEFPGSGKPFIPDGLCWYPDEQTWKMIAHTRIVGGAQKTSLKVTYTTDYGIDTRVVKASRMCGVNLGGKFQRQRDTIWRLDAEFPSLAD